MARKGSRKVRTGCFTCKVRKVKCDEGKPYCQRCLGTGRKCDGYPTFATPGPLSHRPHQGPFEVESVNERRAVQFFCEIAGPFLAGATDPYFWTQLVMQFSSFEPAVRQSVVAISTLYEHVQANPEHRVRLQDSRLALRHYNAAIGELKAMNNQPLVLLVCVLFICIEFLQSNREAAIEHCKHGIAILETIGTQVPWVKEHLVPVFRRLSVFPFFFGNKITDFPSLDCLANLEASPESFSSFTDAHSMMDSIFSRTLQLLREGDPYRLGDSRHVQISAELRKKQEEIRSQLDQWQVLFDNFEVTLPKTAVTEHFQLGEDYMRTMLRTFLAVRHGVCRMWSETAFSDDETAYDAHMDTFRSLVAQCMALMMTVPPGSKFTSQSPKFIFETGFTPMLSFIATKCRCLKTRLQALQLMAVLSVPRENLWEVKAMQGITRRVIEIEHDMVVDDIYTNLALISNQSLPPDEMRVRDTWTEPGASITTTVRGHQVRGRLVGFFIRTQDDTISLHTEFMDEASGPPHDRIRPRTPNIRPSTAESAATLSNGLVTPSPER